MVWDLLRRGLLVGVLAGLLAGAFALLVGEPHLDEAVRLEEQAHATASLRGPVAAGVGDWVVTRDVQRGGLLLASALYGAVVGGLFALTFAVVRGRGARRDDWQLATRLAAALFAAVVLVPFLKYPANPPGVGDPDTIGTRTATYVVLLAGALLALLAAARVAWSVPAGAAPWRAPVAAGGVFAVVAGGLALALPAAEAVPADFPADLLWDFRLSALGTQAVLWSALGLGFGVASLRAARPGAA